MIVVGIDSNSFGFHAVSSEPIWMPGAEDADDEPRTTGWITVGSDAQSRRHTVFILAKQFFTLLPYDAHVFVEEPLILMKNIETTRKLVMMGGIIESAFWQANPDATFYWVDVASWRKRVLGRGSGRKDLMKALAEERTKTDLRERWLRMGGLHFGEDGLLADYAAQPDLYDAHCVMLYGEQVLGALPGAS